MAMQLLFYQSFNQRVPVKEFIEKLQVSDRAHILGCLKSIEELGFETSRVGFRQIRGKLWEIKIRAENIGARVFYVSLTPEKIILLHAYKKQSQKTPDKEIKIAEKRLDEVLRNENDYIR